MGRPDGKRKFASATRLSMLPIARILTSFGAAPVASGWKSLQSRVSEAVERIAGAHPDETVVIVAHHGPIKAFFCAALGIGLETFRRVNIGNASIASFSKGPGGRWYLEMWNDVCHVEMCDRDES